MHAYKNPPNPNSPPNPIQQQQQQQQQHHHMNMGPTPPLPSSRPRRSLGRPSPSFRLRSPSLNSLRLRRIFDLFDRNSDGELSLEELSLALDRLGLGPADPLDLSLAVAPHLRPGRSALDFSDFAALHRSLADSLVVVAAADSNAAAAEDSDMREAFRVFDEDGDGFISAAELQLVLAKLGLPEAGSMSRVEEMICSVDRNRDGRVDFLEFKHMMQEGVSVRGA